MPVDYRARAREIAKKNGIPEDVFLALITAETGWRMVTNPKSGAIGFTQLMPGTARGLGVNPHDPIQNLEGGARYLRQQLDRYGGDMRLALAAYNAGPGNVDKYNGVPPFKETQRYVRDILTATNAGGARSTTATGGVVEGPPTSAGQPGLTPPVGAPDLGQLAFENIGRIARGEAKPTETLSDLAAVAAAPQPEAGTGVAPTPSLGGQAAPDVAPAPVKPGGGWGGSYDVARSYAQIGRDYGLLATSEKRDRRHTASGGVSDHYSGNKSAYAYDLSNGDRPTPEMDAAAAAMARQLGVKYKPGTALNVSKVVNGYRIQILYRTNVGGNHFNHIHVGVRRVA